MAVVLYQLLDKTLYDGGTPPTPYHAVTSELRPCLLCGVLVNSGFQSDSGDFCCTRCTLVYDTGVKKWCNTHSFWIRRVLGHTPIKEK
jgi:hypothetical protein